MPHLQQIIDSRHFAELLAFYQLEPFGEERADIRNAMLMQMIAGMFRGEGQSMPRLEDFMPFMEHEDDQQPAELIEAMLRAKYRPKDK